MCHVISHLCYLGNLRQALHYMSAKDGEIMDYPYNFACKETINHTAMKQRIIYLLVMFVSILSTPTDVSASNDILSYEQPSAKWMGALPLGNGRLGAMVYGGVKSSPGVSCPLFIKQAQNHQCRYRHENVAS